MSDGRRSGRPAKAVRDDRRALIGREMPPAMFGTPTVVLSSLALLFAVIGIPIAIYLTIQHYEGVAPVCSTKGDWFSNLISLIGSHVNCGAVTSSTYSRIGSTNIPITVPGLLWFLTSGILAGWALLAARGKVKAPAWLFNVHLAVAIVGLAFVLFLVYAEFSLIHNVCEWCTGVHVLTLLTFVVVLVEWQRSKVAQYARAG